MTAHSAARYPMSQPQNRYKADLRDVRFLLFEQFGITDLIGKPPFANWGKDEIDAVLDEVLEWSQKTLGPINGPADAVGCTLENGQVKTPAGFKEAWKSLYAAGWRTLAVDEKFGGQAGPFTL